MKLFVNKSVCCFQLNVTKSYIYGIGKLLSSCKVISDSNLVFCMIVIGLSYGHLNRFGENITAKLFTFVMKIVSFINSNVVK